MSQGGCLIQDAKTLLNKFAIWLINHVCREANSVAYKLAKDAPNLVEDLYDLESTVPECILQDVMLDNFD